MDEQLNKKEPPRERASGMLSGNSTGEPDAPPERITLELPLPSELIHSTAPRRRHRRSWLFLALVLLVCLAYLGVSLYMNNPSVGGSRFIRYLPVTGGDGTGQRRTQLAPLLPAVPGKIYRLEAEHRLELCSSSFSSVFDLERMATRRPDMLESPRWIKQTQQAMQDFQQDCGELGSMPTAPSAYAEVDHWLKMAASEVEPVSERLGKVLDKHDPLDLLGAMDHMTRFITYTHNARSALDGMQDRKEI